MTELTPVQNGRHRVQFARMETAYEERFVFKTEASQKELGTLARAPGLISGGFQVC